MNENEKEKAKELIEKFLPYSQNAYGRLFDSRIVFCGKINLASAKQCALISMNEKIAYAKTFGDVAIGDIEEFERIKTEIEKFEQ